jgi:hypothetical protein
MKEKGKCSNIRLKTRQKQQVTDVTQKEEYGRKLRKDWEDSWRGLVEKQSIRSENV